MLNRRDFVKGTTLGLAIVESSQASSAEFVIVASSEDPVVATAPVQWAIRELASSLSTQGLVVRMLENIQQAKATNFCVLAAGSATPLANRLLKNSSLEFSAVPEALALLPTTYRGRRVLLACGQDTRGLVYALLELVDRVRNTAEPVTVLSSIQPIAEKPANSVRSITKLFTSDIEDKPWYNDRRMWPAYLSMLASQRFNRFNLALGIGYDFIRQVTDAYFLFAYPFLVQVPGYTVRAVPLPDSERDGNLQMLKFISEQAVAHGLEFQLGLWMHGYVWINSPHPNYVIEGITKENHGPYCRDAVRLILKECPAISGVTFRVHGESGVQEGSYEFWKSVFDGVATCGRTVRLDMHAKGMNQSMLDMAVATKQPVTLSPKFWAEHMGMPYHQADIRKMEQPTPGQETTGLMQFSAGSRSFLRYGYGDMLREDRPWSVVHRIWPGTQRLLLWGDPHFGRAYSEQFSFCGSAGVEVCEPLSFKGRRGSGIAGGRCGYADTSLTPQWDWEKYAYGYRVWGRLLYNPNAEADCLRRSWVNQFPQGAEHLQQALANASRILPIVTTAYCPSAANNSYWPEIYLNQSLFDSEHPAPYSDSPVPKIFGNVSPLDPELFYRVNDFADDLLESRVGYKYTPLEVAQWIDDCARAATMHLAESSRQVLKPITPEFRRAVVDVQIQAGLGRFFGAKLRAAVLYRCYEKSADREALAEAVRQYSMARDAWAALAKRATGVYVSDITVGEQPQLRGHWLDRLPAIDRDIAWLQKKLTNAPQSTHQPQLSAVISKVIHRTPARNQDFAEHQAPDRFRPKQDLPLVIALKKEARSVTLHFRHVNHGERFETLQMSGNGGVYQSAIPGSYTDTLFPLEYYFEVRSSAEGADMYPGLSSSLTRQPYFVVRRALPV